MILHIDEQQAEEIMRGLFKQRKKWEKYSFDNKVAQEAKRKIDDIINRIILKNNI